MERSVLVTGAGTGIGLATSLLLAERGLEVYGTVLGREQSDAVAEAAAARGVVVRTLELDVTRRESIDRGVQTVVEETGGLWAVVNNAGLGLRGFFEDLSEQEIRATFEVNVFGALEVTRAALPHMRRAGRGRIVLMSSAGGRLAAMSLSGYCAGKFAIEGFGESLALEVAPFGISVSILEPGIVRTPHFTVHRGQSRAAQDPRSPYRTWFLRHEALVDDILATHRITADDVAASVHRALTARRPRLRYVVGFWPRLLVALREHAPSTWFDRVYIRGSLRRVSRPHPRVDGASALPAADLRRKPTAAPADRAVLVTGASSGLGLETALHLASAGFRVFAAMRDPARGRRLREECARKGLSVEIVELDVTDAASIDRAVAAVLAECGAIYGLVNNAGVHVRGYFEDVSEEELRRVFDVNVFGTMAVTRAVLPHMRSAGEGRIVIVGSVAGRLASPALSAYCASKFALEGFGQALAMEAQLVGPKVVVVAPAIVRTEIWARDDALSQGSSSPESPYSSWFLNQERLTERVVARAPTQAADVARIIRLALTLEDPRPRYVVGRRAEMLLALRRFLPGEVFNRIYLGALNRLIGREQASRA